MNFAVPFRPKLLDMLKNYSGKDFTADLIASLTTGIVALPLAMAFAIASGVPLQAGRFLERLGRENVCPHVDAALDRARQILGLPPALPSDPHHEEKQRLESARQELTSALEKVQGALNRPSGKNQTLSPAARPANVGNGN
jgi:hypothetical protein